MPRFRRKSVEIEARKIMKAMTIKTLDGIMFGNPGDWLVTGIRGEQYFMKRGIFVKMYEPVDENAEFEMNPNK